MYYSEGRHSEREVASCSEEANPGNISRTPNVTGDKHTISTVPWLINPYSAYSPTQKTQLFFKASLPIYVLFMREVFRREPRVFFKSNLKCISVVSLKTWILRHKQVERKNITTTRQDLWFLKKWKLHCYIYSSWKNEEKNTHRGWSHILCYFRVWYKPNKNVHWL